MTNFEEKARALVARLGEVDPEVIGLAFGDGLPQLAELRAELHCIDRERWLAKRPSTLVELLPWLTDEPRVERERWYGRLSDGRGYCTDGCGVLVIDHAPDAWPPRSNWGDPDHEEAAAEQWLSPQQMDTVLRVPGMVSFPLPDLSGEGTVDISVARFDRALLRRWVGHALDLAPPAESPRITLGPFETSPGRVDGAGWVAVVMGIKQ